VQQLKDSCTYNEAIAILRRLGLSTGDSDDAEAPGLSSPRRLSTQQRSKGQSSYSLPSSAHLSCSVLRPVAQHAPPLQPHSLPRPIVSPSSSASFSSPGELHGHTSTSSLQPLSPPSPPHGEPSTSPASSQPPAPCGSSSVIVISPPQLPSPLAGDSVTAGPPPSAASAPSTELVQAIVAALQKFSASGQAPDGTSVSPRTLQIQIGPGGPTLTVSEVGPPTPSTNASSPSGLCGVMIGRQGVITAFFFRPIGERTPAPVHASSSSAILNSSPSSSTGTMRLDRTSVRWAAGSVHLANHGPSLACAIPEALLSLLSRLKHYFLRHPRGQALRDLSFCHRRAMMMMTRARGPREAARLTKKAQRPKAAQAMSPDRQSGSGERGRR